MCSKPDPSQFLQSINALVQEVPNAPFADLPWAGAHVYYGLLENA